MAASKQATHYNLQKRVSEGARRLHACCNQASSPARLVRRRLCGRASHAAQLTLQARQALLVEFIMLPS